MVFEKNHYENNGNLAILAREENGEPYGSLTVNVDILPRNCAALDVNNYPNAEETAKELGAEPTGINIPSGFCMYPVYDFSNTKYKD